LKWVRASHPSNDTPARAEITKELSS
jgi:hypothetical protein